MQTEIDVLAKKIWDYHLLHHELRKADAIFVLCSNDTRVAERAVQLFQEGYAPILIFSGNVGVLTQGQFSKPEADTFADIARTQGVPDACIFVENKSTNTGENIVFTKRLIEEKELQIRPLILIQKPYMERRTLATFAKQWPEMHFIVTSPQIPFEGLSQ